ncbi:MAG: diguanylate cyclase [Trueperaceae bacterium]|nr:diguanylate cyclase [Trueperaceae bacterium]
MITSALPGDVQLPPHLLMLVEELNTLPPTGLERIELLCDLAWELRRLDTQESIRLAREALRLSEAIKLDKGRASSLLSLGFAQMRLADFEQAKNYAETAYQLFQKLNDASGSYKALNLLGTIHGQLGELSQALAKFLETQKLCESLNDSQGAAAALNNAALTHTYLGDFASALELYLQALNHYENMHYDEGVARTLTNLGSAYYELNRFEEALESFEHALKRQGEWRDQNVHAYILMGIGQAQQNLGRLDEALNNTHESLKLCESSDNRLGMANAFDALATIFVKQGKNSEAEDNFLKALSMVQTLGDRLEEVKISLKLAELWHSSGKSQLALKLILKGLSIAQEIGSKAEIYKAHQLLSSLYEEQEEFANALRHHKSYASLKDEVFNANSDLKLQSLRVTHQVEQTKRESEIFRLKNVALAEANEKLRALNQSLHDLNEQKTSLLCQLERQAREDALTGLFNRRYFDEQMQVLFPSAKKKQKAFSMMICDIDNFKQVNDNYSHQIGDEVLKKVADILRSNLRESDILARYGGEEFVLCMPGTDLALAAHVCERLRECIQNYDWRLINPNLNVTLSMGLASNLTVENHEKLLSIADVKLYEAKRSGKNRLSF